MSKVAVKNIISNSIKYTSKGDKINIFAGKLHNDIYIKVEETAGGFPRINREHLFERFYRVERTRRAAVTKVEQVSDFR